MKATDNRIKNINIREASGLIPTIMPEASKIAYIISNFGAFASIEYGHAVFVAECTKSNEVYRLKYKYNVLDYYDYSPEAVPGLYKLNRYGCAKNYLTTGYDEGSASFTVDGEITFTDSTEND